MCSPYKKDIEPLMGKIRVLPEEVINKIAAGEVIERPASVVKELIENSLDAQSTAITVAVRHSGKELIRVTDNGTGMCAEDAANALKRHATSKIETVDDIFRIRSFGFRGEALPSIAAISRLSLLTRETAAALGTEIKLTGGIIESTRETGMSCGTTVEVADLFFNTPARRKFLRSEKAEFLSIVDTVTRFAFGNPTVEFKLVKDSKMFLDCFRSQNLRERIAQIHGDELVSALISLQASAGEIEVYGLISDPAVTRVNRTGQFFFINNRPINSPGLSFALRHGYEDMVPSHRHPLAFLFFDIETSRVDVNVHPNKSEVRIANERDVQKFLGESVRQTLHVHRKFPNVRVDQTHQKKENVLSLICRENEERHYTEVNGSLALELDTGDQTRQRDYHHVSPDEAPKAPSVSEEIPLYGREGKHRGPRIIGQFQATYVLAENEGQLLIVDQHAAHERIVYEKIMETFTNTCSPSQLQLIPLTITLDYREQEVIEEYAPLLDQIGFGINNLGRNTYSLDAVPAFLDSVDPKALLLDFIHDAVEWGTSRSFDDKKRALAASIACKSKTIKGSSCLVPEQMEYLLKSLLQTNQPLTCPHGRPTCITLTLPDLEKQFGRR